MKTVLIFGASATHGVGGAHGGWADRLKTWLHETMYGLSSSEDCTVYELGVLGDTVRDVIGRFEIETLARMPSREPEETFVIFSAGLNDSKATNKPDNFSHMPDEYATNVQVFIRLAREHAKHILCVGLHPVDQTKTNPKPNPLTGGTSYFTNQRIKRFEDALVQACKDEKTPCVPLFSSVPTNWKKQHLYADGIHPNDAGHEWIFSQVQPELRSMLKVR